MGLALFIIIMIFSLWYSSETTGRPLLVITVMCNNPDVRFTFLFKIISTIKKIHKLQSLNKDAHLRTKYDPRTLNGFLCFVSNMS